MQQVRIIGGVFRGRQISFPALSSIRPTPNRVRETVFNWLAPIINHAHCLDLFAGSGALGFEALSRGAKHTVMADKSPLVIQHLRKIAVMLALKKEQIMFCQGSAPENIFLPLDVSKRKFDIVFLDPPFHRHYIQTSCQWLKNQNLLHEHSRVYLELENKTKLNSALSLPFNLIKSGKTSQTAYYLIKLKLS